MHDLAKLLDSWTMFEQNDNNLRWGRILNNNQAVGGGVKSKRKDFKTQEMTTKTARI